MQTGARSATHSCPWWANGFSRAEKARGFGSFKLNEHMVSILEAERVREEAAWASGTASLNREPGRWAAGLWSWP